MWVFFAVGVILGLNNNSDALWVNFLGLVSLFVFAAWSEWERITRYARARARVRKYRLTTEF